MHFIKRIFLLFIALFIVCYNASAQNLVTFSGSITDPAAGAIHKVSIHVLNTNFHAISDKAGFFEIKNIPASNYIVQVSAVGFAERHLMIDLHSSRTIAIVLQQASVYLNEVIVTAQKKEEKLQDIPFSLSVISPEEVRQYRLWNSKDITGIVPNLYASNPGDNRNVISIRGLTSTSYDPAVTTYIDGVSQFSLDTYIAELLDIDRIEVLRGPQGTLYGRNAMAGVINIITKQPTGKTSGFAELNAGNYGLRRYAAGLRFPVNKKIFAGIAMAFNKHNGYYTNEFNRDAYDEQQSITGNYYLKYLPAPKWSISLNAKHQLSRNNGAFPLVFGMQQAFDNPYKLVQNAIAEMNDNIFNTSLSVNFTGRVSNFSSQTTWQYNYRFYNNPLDADFSPLEAVAIFNNYGRRWNNSRVLTQEFRFVSSPYITSPWKWTIGSYWFLHKNPVKQATQFGKDAPMIGIPDSLFSIINTTTAKNKGYAVYGQASYAITKKLEVIAGLRYDREHRSLSVLSEYQKDPDPHPLFALIPDTAAAVKLDAFSPKAGLLLHLNDRTNLYFNYSRGYRTGGLTQLSTDATQVPLHPYEPEFSNNFELGIKNKLLEHRLYANAAIFFSSVKNVQVPTLVLPDAITITRNTGKLTSKGVEIELLSAPVKRLQLVYNLGYTDANYKKLSLSVQGQQKNFSGNRQVFTPEVTSMLAGQYDLGITSQINFTMRVEWFYLGTQYFDLANTIRQSAYHLLNVHAGISFRKFELKFWARNLTDYRYIDFAYDFGGVHLGNPRTYGLTARVRI